MKIDKIALKIIQDSRGNDTLEAEFVSGNYSTSASVPSGKSTGKREAFVLEPKLALKRFEEIKPQLIEKDFSSLKEFDNFLISLDGTFEKKNLGGNLILVLSIAFLKLLAKSQNQKLYKFITQFINLNTNYTHLPLCFFNVINGGLHANLPASGLPFQEYLFVPQNNLPSENLNSVMLLLKTLGDLIQNKYEKLKMGYEGGYEIPEKDPETGLEILKEAIGKSDQKNSRISLDIAASTFFKDSNYLIGDKIYSTDKLLDFFSLLTSHFSLLSIEDPFSENDLDGFQKLTSKIGDKVWIIGDDLTTTNPERIKLMVEKKACNAVIIKPNQIGTITETLEAVKSAKNYGWKIVISHRSGETMDTFIADLSVGIGADGLKSGCPLQKERLVKYQRLIQIEKEILGK